MTVRELLARMDSAELSEWLAFFRIEPMEDGYWQEGLAVSTMENPWSSKRRKRYRPERVQSAAEGLAILDRMMVRQRKEG